MALGLFSFDHPMFLSVFVLAIVTVAAGIAASGVIGRTATHINDAANTTVADAGFRVTDLHFSGAVRTPKESVLAALNLRPGRTIFQADLFAARSRLLHLPWVADAQVRRRYPGKINVTIEERQPFARFQTQNGIFVIERSGRIVTGCAAGAFGKLPMVVGDGAPAEAGELIEAVRRHPAVAAHVTLYQYQTERRWDLVLDNVVRVKLPEDDWQKQIGALEKLIVAKNVLARNVGEIDLRSQKYVFFRPLTGQPSGGQPSEKGRAI